ncbi:MAG: hypothetical protein QOJ12_296, partial [Thermoleophilales bacterium]|nr:hypothetical protein [Thermoleophilales bacterium]
MHGNDAGRAGSGAGRLLERDSERDALAELIEAARSGSGRASIVEGQPGIGKTALLDTARAMADARGVTCLAASGSAYEQTFPFGVARQLFEPALAALTAGARAEVLTGAAGLARDVADAGTVEPDGPPPDRLALEHGLYWLCLNLSSISPLFLVVDDAHWADESSLRWLHYLARRIGDAPIAIVVAARSTHPEGPVPVVEAIKALATTTVLGPRPLSVAAARTVIAEVFGAEPDDDFARASHTATAGNPFLLIELARSLRADGLEPTSANAALTSQARPEAVARSVLARLARLSPVAVAVARVSAVLPDGAPLRHAARLAHVDVESAAAAVDELVAAGLLDAGRVIRLAHPLVRAALDGELASGERARLNGQAARLLAGDGERGERVAGHLMLTVPAADDWVVAELRRAAREALARGAPETVARYLSRAVDEPPRPEERARVIGELGMAEAQAGLGTAVEHLHAAAEQVEDPRERALLARWLAQMLFQSGRPDAAVRALKEVLVRPLDADARMTLEAEAMAMTEIGGLHDGGAPDLPSELGGGTPQGDSPGRRCLLATRAARLSRRAPGTARQVVALAVAALGDGALAAGEGAGSLFFSAAVTALVWSDAFEEAEPEVDQALARGRAGGSRFAVGQGSWLAGLLA